MSTDTLFEGRAHLPQEIETPLTVLETSFGTALFFYARSIDSVQSSTVGQDYVAYRYGKTDLVFAVCDGVGQSFIGDLAARLLGEALLDWLWDNPVPLDADEYSDKISTALNEQTQSTAQHVAEYQLPDGLPAILKQALEMQRAYGSESMFVAGRLALGGPEPRVGLCWLGDSPVAAIDIDGKLVDLGPKGHTSERWNATTGVKGTIHTWVSTAQKVARVAGYTDGLGLAHAPTDAQLAALIEEWGKSPPSDDASLFDVRLAPSLQTIGNTQPPQGDIARPISVQEERSPVAEIIPITDLPAIRSSIESWRPLLAEKAQQAETKSEASAPDEAATAQQQIRVWQQAALLGLTSAALAMLMLERLIDDNEKSSSGGSGPAS
jgi:hypothetical protein